MKRLIVLLLSLPLFVGGQGRPREVWEGGNLPAHQVGPNDLLSISVVGAPELSRSIRVADDGFIQLPLLKERISVQGLLPAGIEQRIVQALVREELYVDPVVTVTIMEYFSRPITVSGAVRKPVTFQSTGQVHLLDAIGRAEGLANDAGPDILVSRKGEALTGLPQRIPIRELMSGPNSDLNLVLQGGEEIRVPEAGKIFVVGNVKRPGAFPVQQTDGLSVLKLLALSEGLLPFSAKHAYVIRRDAGPSGRKETAIPLKEILARKSPDVNLSADEILYVPDNQGRRLSLATLERVISFGSTTASGLLIWGAAR